MSRSVGLAHIIRNHDEPATGIWGLFGIRSAFQPIFEFCEGKLAISAFEGLVRPVRDGHAVSPGQFFKAIPQVDRMEVETLTRTLHILNAGKYLDPATNLFVNFDPAVFIDQDIIDEVLRDMRLTLREAEIDPARIVCEVTEHRVQSHQSLLAFVAALRDHGFRIAVDDYGAEDSDMARIREIKPEIVKFDAQWIVKLMDSAPGFNLLRTMVETFDGWGITTLFEGIEEHWQLDLADKCGVRLVQGFVLARPEIAPTSFSVFSQSAGGAGDTRESVAARAHDAPGAQAPHDQGRPDARLRPDTGGVASGPGQENRVSAVRPFGRRKATQ
ncbi:MAG: EAL domain-containing protein [Notoacmeibacter sp.]|nr:EAL domain-containing protein [Notoacmeibacter sp.]